MKLKNIFLIISLTPFFIGCSDFLDRPPLTTVNDDEKTWSNEDLIRLYANKYYPIYFSGYSGGSAPLINEFNDDVVNEGAQGNFARSVPISGIWNMGLVRSINIMIERLNTYSKDKIPAESFNHWNGVARFFRAMEYAGLSTYYGDVPYYDHVLKDKDLDDLYKPRTPRNEVMDAVYEDLKYAFDNVRLNDGDQNVNKHIVAGFTSRIALTEGTWQKYYYQNKERAKKFLELAVTSADFIINSGKYAIDTDFRSLFTSTDLSGCKECIIHRNYDAAAGVTHSIASYSNPTVSIIFGGTTDLIKSFICTDGNVWQKSNLSDAKEFNVSTLVKTRDSRFEATFYDMPNKNSRGSYLFPVKFFPREVVKLVTSGGATPVEYSLANNPTDHPVLRYSEVLLNWIEAKAELEALGGKAVSQADIDNSINKIRNRPLAKDAEAKGVVKTQPLQLAALPDDPMKDADVPSLIWEIRRERRMEFAFEHYRHADLKRWHKLQYMDTDANKDLLSGTWVDFPNELPAELKNDNKGKISVVTIEGKQIVFDGTNKNQMKGFFKHPKTTGRLPFLNQVNVNPYLAPVGKNQIDDYASKGYKLHQTEGWPQN